MDDSYKKDIDRRQYIRIDSVLPVQFILKGYPAGTEWMQGFTDNIGKGGICLSVNNLKQEYVDHIRINKPSILLRIGLPFQASEINAEARVAWIKESFGPGRHLIGLRYENIGHSDSRKIMRYVLVKKFFPRAALSVLTILFVAFLVNTFVNIILIKGNKELVVQLVKIVQDSSIAKQKIKELSRHREDLMIKINALQLQIKTAQEARINFEEKNKAAISAESTKVSELNRAVESLIKEREILQQRLSDIQLKESNITEDLLKMDKRRAVLEKDNFDKMYHWLKVHQNERSGLVVSFEGDSNISDWAFLYDQSLVSQAYIYFKDFERAKKILDFFAKHAKRKDGLFYNAYYVKDGSVAEYNLHSGPNIWIGIAILHYSKQAKDNSYIGLAKDIARAIINLQNSDTEGGIRGGPGINWYSTEHNLDAYAFFSMLYKMTSDKLYENAANTALNWLLKHTYDKSDVPIKRGKGDSTIATDTYAWSIAAVGPQKLEELGMNPDRIIEFAEENCLVEVSYMRPEGKSVKVKGFDFALSRNLGRGGAISAEWTAQMIMAYKIMAEFYYKKNMIAKERAYSLKADEYLSHLSKMIISSPSASGQGEGCLPYSTLEETDTGHGWNTPRGKSTGSVAATSYAIFAYYNYNPLDLE